MSVQNIVNITEANLQQTLEQSMTKPVLFYFWSERSQHCLQLTPVLESLAAQCENLIVVSNEVFSGGADYAGDTGRYLLALAQVNNAFAARADAVVRVVCGIPVYYKGVEK